MERTKIKLDSLWEQKEGSFVGRRGRVSQVAERVTLEPAPGFCPCPARQIRTRIKVETFLKEWEKVKKKH